MKTSCVIPAYNEASTIQKVLRTVKKVESIQEIIVVDDGSTDDTFRTAEAEGVRVIRHETNRGKGAAIKTGYAHSTGDVILFLDADLQSLTPKKITSILQPIRNDEADFVKTSFHRSRGRVTELVAKPLLRIVHPHLNFEQPLSGQFALRRELMKDLRIDDRWGVDIQILLQLVKNGVRTAEVNIGRLKHKKQPIESLTAMSEQVMRSILSEMGVIANRHSIIIFDFDKTIIEESSVEIMAQEYGFEKELEDLRQKHRAGEIKDRDITLSLAKLLRGKTLKDLEKACEKMHLTKNMVKVAERLKKRRYHLAIVSVAFSPVVEHFAGKIGIKKENIICAQLLTDKEGRCTGEVVSKVHINPKCCDRIICKAKAAGELMKKMSIRPGECIAVADGKSDECLFRACSLSLAFRPEKTIGDVIITDMTEILIHAE
jgi:HAD superfamily phosphoserine phosphatase-like hydrolase